MEQLIVRLGSDSQSPVFWIVWSESEQEIIASGELPDAQALSSLSERAGVKTGDRACTQQRCLAQMG